MDENALPAPELPGWRRGLRMSLFLLGPILIGAGTALMGLLMLAFASDAGIRDEELAARMMAAFVWSCVVFAFSGVPLAVSVVAAPLRRKRWRRIGYALAGVGILSGLICVVLYIRALV